MGQLNHDTVPLWEGWQRREFLIAHCHDCDTWIHLPRRICPECWSERIGFDPVGGNGRVASWSLPRTVASDVPPVITALVDLDGAVGVRFLARLAGCDPTDVRFELPVVLDWRTEDDVTYPQFRPAPGSA